MPKNMKIKPMYSFRLLAFNAYDEEEKTSDSNQEDNGSSSFKQKEYKVQMFGINDRGETASIIVEGFTPYFYIKVENNWDDSKMSAFLSQIKKDIGSYHEKGILKTKYVSKKKLYGFDAGENHTFILLKFNNEGTMRKVKNLWYTSGTKKGVYQRVLNPEGYLCKEYSTKTFLYEAQIPSLLRLFHIKDISPSGWIGLPTTKARKMPKKNRSTICTHEFIIHYKDIKSQPDKEIMVPYKICSFDIEASSSHGDFPLAIKDYKKLAINIVDCWREQTKEYDIDQTQGRILLKQILKTAFSIGNSNIDNIEKVFPKYPLMEESFSRAFDNWFETVLDEYNTTTIG